MADHPSSKIQSSYRGFVQFKVLGADFLLIKPSFSQPLYRLLTSEEINRNADALPSGWDAQPQDLNPTNLDDQNHLSGWFKNNPTLTQLSEDFGKGNIQTFLSFIEKMSIRDIKIAFPTQGFQAKLTLLLIFKDQAGPGSGLGYEDWIRIKEFELRITESSGEFSEEDWKQMEEKADAEWESAKEEREFLSVVSRL